MTCEYDGFPPDIPTWGRILFDGLDLNELESLLRRVADKRELTNKYRALKHQLEKLLWLVGAAQCTVPPRLGRLGCAFGPLFGELTLLVGIEADL